MRKSWNPSSVTPPFEGVSTNQEMLAVTVSVTRSLPHLGSISHTHTQKKQRTKMNSTKFSVTKPINKHAHIQP